ncbi:MAG: selenide, water dikinase SelD [Nitrospirae bacterium]|nr:selenide, water dikinase SelD [Nitrospirota bacterium]
MHDILSDLKITRDPRVIIGPGDDAGVCIFNDGAMVETVDVITPLVDDPYTFGAISAANSMSDVYAMGGIPVSALAILGFASCEFEVSVIKSLLRGAVDKLREAKVSLIGGHSIEDSELKFGLSVVGSVSRDKILRTNGASAGDALLLTKPLGTGILSSAFKKGAIKSPAFSEAVSSMLTLNKTASKIAVLSGSCAATDVTGFGLLGHSLNMLRNSKLDFVINYAQVPLMKRVMDLALSGIIPRGAHSNLEFASSKVDFPKGFSKESRLVLSDPQTSGGLLIALPKKYMNKFARLAKKDMMSYWLIGEVADGKGRIVIK